MTIEFSCSQCSSELRVDAAHQGKKTRCPRCGMIQLVPDSTRDLPASTTPSTASTGDSGSLATTWYRPPSESDSGTAGAVSATDESATDAWLMKTPDGNIYGPVPRRELDEWSKEGRISSQCLIRQQGQSNWESALQLYPSLARATHTGSRVRGASTRATGAYETPHIQISGDDARLPRRNRGNLICLTAIIGLMMPFFPPISIAALIWGYSERKSIERGEASAEKRSAVDVGFFVALFGTLISLGMLPMCN